jgi:hypothetical protein
MMIDKGASGATTRCSKIAPEKLPFEEQELETKSEDKRGRR